MKPSAESGESDGGFGDESTRVMEDHMLRALADETREAARRDAAPASVGPRPDDTKSTAKVPALTDEQIAALMTEADDEPIVVEPPAAAPMTEAADAPIVVEPAAAAPMTVAANAPIVVEPAAAAPATGVPAVMTEPGAARPIVELPAATPPSVEPPAAAPPLVEPPAAAPRIVEPVAARPIVAAHATVPRTLQRFRLVAAAAAGGAILTLGLGHHDDAPVAAIAAAAPSTSTAWAVAADLPQKTRAAIDRAYSGLDVIVRQSAAWTARETKETPAEAAAPAPSTRHAASRREAAPKRHRHVTAG